MNAFAVNKLNKKLIDCPNCKNNILGKNEKGEQEGALIIGEKEITRKCKCGLVIVLNESDADSKNLDSYIKMQVDCFLKGITLEELYNSDDEIHPQQRN